MATEKDINDLFLNHVNSNAVKTRKMMGEYIIYYDSVVIGGLYDNRLLVKATKSAQQKLQDNTLVSPYPGAKEMILIPDFDEATNLTDLFKTIKNDLQKWSLIAILNYFENHQFHIVNLLSISIYCYTQIVFLLS